MTDRWFACQTKTSFSNLKKMRKTKKLESDTEVSWNVWQACTADRKLNPKLEEYSCEHGPIHLASVNLKQLSGKKKMRLDVSSIDFIMQRILRILSTFETSPRAHKSRNALAFIRYILCIFLSFVSCASIA